MSNRNDLLVDLAAAGRMTTSRDAAWDAFVPAETKLTDHLRSLLANVARESADPSVRASNARVVSDAYRDIVDSGRARAALLSGGVVADILDAKRGDKAAEQRLAERAGFDEVRGWADWSDVDPRSVEYGKGGTGLGVFPLIRLIAEEWRNPFGKSPVLPGIPDDTDSAVIDPDPEAAPLDSTSVTIDDVGVANARHLSVMVLNLARQIDLSWLTPEARKLLDQAVFDTVDKKAEEYVAGELVTAAGGTRAAGSDLAAALDDAEHDAGTRDVVEFALVNPADVPLVRRALAPTFYDGPHPSLLPSTGQPAGTATFVGRSALYLFKHDYLMDGMDEPALLGRGMYVARPFYFAIRDEDAIQTVTGIGA